MFPPAFAPWDAEQVAGCFLQPHSIRLCATNASLQAARPALGRGEKHKSMSPTSLFSLMRSHGGRTAPLDNSSLTIIPNIDMNRVLHSLASLQWGLFLTPRLM